MYIYISVCICIQQKAGLNIGRKFLAVRVLGDRHRLPREVVDAPSLVVFKARLNGVLSNLVWCKMSLAMAEELERDDL